MENQNSYIIDRAVIPMHQKQNYKFITTVAGYMSIFFASYAYSSDIFQVKQIYSSPIVKKSDKVTPIKKSLLIGQDRILLEDHNRRLYMCNTTNGHLLWSIHFDDLVKDFPELHYNKGGRLYHARYIRRNVVEFIIISTFHAYLLQYNETNRNISKHDVTKLFLNPFPKNSNTLSLMTFFKSRDLWGGEFVGLNYIPSHENLYIGIKGWYYKKTFPLVDLKNEKIIFTLKPKPAKSWITSFSFSPDGKYACATGDSVYVWDLTSGDRINDAYQPEDKIIQSWLVEGALGGGYGPEYCAFSHDSKTLAVGSRRELILIFDVLSGELKTMVEQPKDSGSFTYVTFLGKSNLILGFGMFLHIFDVDLGTFVRVKDFTGDNDFMPGGTVSVDDSSIYVSDYVGNLRRFDWTIIHED